jgi:hypothetical protein
MLCDINFTQPFGFVQRLYRVAALKYEHPPPAINSSCHSPKYVCLRQTLKQALVLIVLVVLVVLVKHQRKTTVTQKLLV